MTLQERDREAIWFSHAIDTIGRMKILPHPSPLPLLEVGGQMSDSFESAK